MSQDRPTHPLSRAGGYLLVFLVLQIVVGVPALMIWAIVTDTNPMTLAMGEGPAGELALFVYALLAPVMIPVTLVFLRRFDHRDLASIGARLPAGGWRAGALQALAATGGVVAGLGVWLAVAAIAGEVRFAGLAESFRAGPGWAEGPLGGAGALAILLAGFLVQGGLEEWVFRGYVYQALRERWSWATVAGATSLAFAFLHAMNPAVTPAALVNTFLLGLVLAAMVELTGSLAAAVVAHGLWNFAIACVLSLPVSGVETFHLLTLEVAGAPAVTGGEYGPEGSWVLTAMLVPLIAALAVAVDRRAAVPAAQEPTTD